MKIVFAGTPDIAVPSLEALLEAKHDVSLVVTQPDRPKGRGRKTSASAVKQFAEKRGLRVMQPARASSPDFLEILQAEKADVGVVVAYGQILSEAVLEQARLGWVNVHFSLLPKYRGASPVAAAIRDGETTTGVTIFRLTRELDAGPMLVAHSVDIEPGETAGALASRLARSGAELIPSTLEKWARGAITPRPQDATQASYCPKLDRSSGKMDWTQPALRAFHQFRSATPRPGAFALFRGRDQGEIRVGIAAASLVPATPGQKTAPGEILAISREGIDVQCGLRAEAHALRLIEVHPEGRRPMPAAAFANGYRVAIGDRFC